MSDEETTSKDPIEVLNSLQTNATDRYQNKLNAIVNRHAQKLNGVKTFIERIGISTEILEENLSIIHIAGTKGKGSTCAYCESILRHHGYKTGFYSSPHLLSVQERIRIDGVPISNPMFEKYFWFIYEKLYNSRTEELKMPTYFQFLTIMAFYVFLEEKVDVVILEVGLGGVNDCTNILKNVPVVGITTLQVEHTNALGSTIEEIAWHKAGIMKPGCVAITVMNQKPAALQTLKEEALKHECLLIEAPPMSEYFSKDDDILLGIPGSIQSINASLAVQLVKAWLNRNSLEYRLNLEKQSFDLSIDEKIAAGLKNCRWPGRNQKLVQDGCIYYIDGAHTSDSIELCVEWYMSSLKEEDGRSYKKVLIFNSIGNRDLTSLLLCLVICSFDLVLFCPNLSFSDPDAQPASLKNLMVTHDQMLKRCEEHREIWLKMMSIFEKSQNIVEILPSVSDAVEFIKEHKKMTSYDLNYHILVTGSLHLVGNVINVLDPTLDLSLS